MNKKLLLATVAAAAISSSASANYLMNDNMYTGFNFGVQGGVSINDYDVHAKGGSLASKISFDETDTSGTIGAFLGFGHQMDNNFYLGLEVEGGFQFGDASKRKTISGTTYKAEMEPEWNIGVNAQIGYVVDPGLLLYIFGGVNFQEYDLEIRNITAGTKKTDDEMHVGGKIGAGVRYKFYDQVFGDLKYDYNFFEEESVKLATGEKLTVDPCQHNVRVGIGMII